MARHVIVLLATCLAIANGVSVFELEREREPSFCNGLDCPRFTVLSKTKVYEERSYEASKWTSTLVTGTDYRSSVSEGFMKLFQYISGNNEARIKVAMTAPVITKVEPGQGPACASNFTISFMVPFADQDNPPKPSDPTVFLSELPALKAYTRSFGGFASFNDFVTAAHEMDSALNGTSGYTTDYYYTAGYDSPYKLFDRHNEVWFIEV
ncbi:heme-binding protein 2-like [Glandiceps talaboti]